MDRWMMRDRLRWLQDLLYRPELSLRELDVVRSELERFDRVFVVLIRHCQLILGCHAERLPSLAVFRDRLDDGTAGPEMVVIPAGTFMMGSPEDEVERFDHEGPRHRVTIARPFAIGRFPVTFAGWDVYATATGQNRGRGRWPVIRVNWTDAQDYLRWLAEQTGRFYRLPSEAEWEYVARAGTTTPYWWGETADEARANFNKKIGRNTEVGHYPANPWGLSDTAGNVWEWCGDGWHDSYDGAPTDGTVWPAPGGVERVVRGGAWFVTARYVRAAVRSRFLPDDRYDFLGFRCARVLS